MDTMKLGNLDIPLPYVARDLCREAVTLADELRGNVSDKALQEYFKKFLAEYMNVLSDIVTHGLPDIGFDPFNLSTIPESLLEDDPTLSRTFAKFSKSQDFIKSASEAQDGDQDLQSAAMLLLYVDQLRELEAQAIKGGKPDYKGTMAVTSQQILSLHRLIVAQKSLPPQAELYAHRLKRVRGARKGGAAKANRLKDLRDLVLQEARQNFAGIPATKAAKAIYQKLSAQGNWLQDENGKMLLADPETRFTAWIREDKAEYSA